MSETITGFKGFDKDLKCKDYQYEVGKEFEEEGKIAQMVFIFVKIL